MFFGSRVPFERVVSRLGEPYVDPAAVGRVVRTRDQAGVLQRAEPCRQRAPGQAEQVGEP